MITTRTRLSPRSIRPKQSIHSFSTSTSSRINARPFWQAQDAAVDSESTRIAVLGGGITGLTYAYLASKVAPKAQIDVFESSSRWGGWLQSSSLNVEDRTVIFEHGPRSLRPALTAAGVATIDLIRDLGLEDQVLPTAKDSPAARNRFVYYPDKLAHMPDPRAGISGLLKDLSQPVFKGSILPAALEFARPRRVASLEDESIESFIGRRFSAAMADNLVSAMIHGIYAGSIAKLSVKSIMPALWYQEMSLGGLTGSIMKNSRSGRRWQRPQDFQLLLDLCGKQRDALPAETVNGTAVLPDFSKSSIYTFKQGIEQLAQALVAALERTPNVTLHSSSSISGLKPVTASSKNGKIEVSRQVADGKQEKDEFTRVVSALPASALLSACTATGTFTERQALENSIPSVTVMVVNIYYRESDLVPHKGFGYLIPRSVATEHNPDGVLGVVFDSDATPELDNAGGTKLTVMIGGQWWDGKTQFPSQEDGVQISKSLLRRHLGIQAEPLASKATLQRKCIPQYVVGHQEKVDGMQDLLNSRFGSSLEVIGASWNGVSVNDCIKDAYLAARRLQNGARLERSSVPGQAYDFSQVSKLLSM